MRFFLMSVAAWVIFTVFVEVFAISHNGRQMRLLPKWAWLAMILVMPFVGGILYLTVGRPVVKPEPPTRSVAPDDNPDFLADLEERLRQQDKDKDTNDD